MNQNAWCSTSAPAEAFAPGHLTGARNCRLTRSLRLSDTLKKYKEKPVVVYDESGSLAASATRQLAAQGFTKAVNLRGGIVAWRTENLPRPEGLGVRAESRDVHGELVRYLRACPFAVEAKEVEFEDIDVERAPTHAPR